MNIIWMFISCLTLFKEDRGTEGFSTSIITRGNIQFILTCFYLTVEYYFSILFFARSIHVVVENTKTATVEEFCKVMGADMHIFHLILT